MYPFAKNAYALIVVIGNFLTSFVLLAMRLFWGWEFFAAGRDKLANIGPVVEFFHSLEIPLPTINAYMVATIECVGGLCLVIGLASRLVSLPLMIVMTVALFTAHYDVMELIFDNPQGVVSLVPFNFLLTTIIIFAFGPGAFSLDAILKHLFFKTEHKEKIGG